MAKPKTEAELEAYRQTLLDMKFPAEHLERVISALIIADASEEKILDLCDAETEKHVALKGESHNEMVALADGLIVALLRTAAALATHSNMTPEGFLTVVTTTYIKKYGEITGKNVLESIDPTTLEKLSGIRIQEEGDIVSSSVPLTTKKNSKPN